MLAFSLLFLNAIAAVLLLWKGVREERAIVVLMIAYVAATPFLQPWTIFGTFRVGILLEEIFLFLALWWGTERIDRWWLVMAGGAQVIALTSHIVPLVLPEIYIWTDVSIRLAAWVVISTSLIAGAWETWALQKVASGGHSDVEGLGVRIRS